MADDALIEEWSASSNECTQIQLVRGDGHVTATFTPEFTYPIFGEEEAIFGYQDLQINLSFAAHSLQPHLEFSYGKTFPKNDDIQPTDIKEAFAEFLPTRAISDLTRAEVLKDGNAQSFKPPGSKIHEYKRNGEQFEIWMASLHDAEARTLLENIQILILMFIEGGSMLQLEQDWTTHRWRVFFLYKVEQAENLDDSISPYSLVGYGTAYRVFTFSDRQAAQIDSKRESQPLPDSLESWTHGDAEESPLDLTSRERLSQFLILPPFHRAGHGSELYNAMYEYLVGLDNVQEFTVEDPNESFDNLRDVCDLMMLRRRPDFAALRVQPNIPTDKLAKEGVIPIDLIVSAEDRRRIMAETKLMQRQFDRLVEMHTLSFIPRTNRSKARITRKEKSSNEHDRTYYFWRLYAKQRLYVFNRDPLSQLEHEERVEKLEAALDSVQEGYEQLLDTVEAKEARIKAATIDGDIESSQSRRLGKRKIVDEDEDEDGEAAQDSDGIIDKTKKTKIS